MHTFAKNNPKTTQQTESANPIMPRQVLSRQSLDTHLFSRLQRTIGNKAVQQMLAANRENRKGEPTTGFPHVGHDFSQIPVFSQHKEAAPDVVQDKFKTWGSAGGLSGLTLDVTFSITNTPATSLQAIQTVMATGGPRKVGAYRWKWKGKTWDAFVDGGKNSPYVTIAGNSPAHPTKPYYLTPAEVAAQVSFSKDAGTIRIYDRPAAATLWDEVHFETAVVATNFKGKKKDKILKAFKWGWRGKGTKPTIKKGTRIAGSPSGISVHSSVSPGFRNIVKNDYPKYDFI